MGRADKQADEGGVRVRVRVCASIWQPPTGRCSSLTLFMVDILTKPRVGISGFGEPYYHRLHWQ